MDKHFQVGDKVTFDWDNFYIVCSGRISGITIREEDKEKTATVTHISNSQLEKYPIKINTYIGGINKFSPTELRKL